MPSQRDKAVKVEALHRSKVTIDLNNVMFTFSNQSSLSTKKLHGPNRIFPFWPERSNATVMSRFIYGYYGDDLLWSGFTDFAEGKGGNWAIEFSEGLVR